MADEAATTAAATAATADATTAPAAAAATTQATPVAEVPLLGGDPPADNAAAAAPAAAAPDEPAAIVVTLPEGASLDQPRLDAYQGILKDAGLSQEQADKLTPFLFGQMQALQEQQALAWADVTKSWRASVENDAEIGGANLKQSLRDAALARDTYGSPEFKALLADSSIGIGNHPAVVKFLAAVGKAASEDTRGAERQQGAGIGDRDRSIEAVGNRMFPGQAS